MRFPIALAAAVVALGCTSPTSQVSQINAMPLIPQSNQEIAVDNLMIIVDTSGSVREHDLFLVEKAMVQSFVASAPKGYYQAGQIVFGGESRQTLPLETFNRTRLSDAARRIQFLDRSSELHEVLDEVRMMLKNQSGRTSIVLFSDGHPTEHHGTQPGAKMALASAQRIAMERDDQTCFFTVQTAEDLEGEAFLRDLSRVTSCGDYRSTSSMRTITQLHAFERSVFLSKALPEVAARRPDSGADDLNLCPQSLRGEQVTSDGCSLSPILLFPHDSSRITKTAEEQLDRFISTLKQMPNSEIRIEGFTDSIGSPNYNQDLSSRRARAVLQYIESTGVNPSRFLLQALGENRPRFPNHTPEDRAGNRRVEFSQLPK